MFEILCPIPLYPKSGCLFFFQNENQVVFVQPVTTGIEAVSRVWMEPVKEDDWEILVRRFLL